MRVRVARLDGVFGFYREHATGESLHITYAGLVVGHDFRRCMEFLDLKVPEGDTADEYVRLNEGDILARFAPEDHDAVRETVAGLGHPEWAGAEP